MHCLSKPAVRCAMSDSKCGHNRNHSLRPSLLQQLGSRFSLSNGLSRLSISLGLPDALHKLGLTDAPAMRQHSDSNDMMCAANVNASLPTDAAVHAAVQHNRHVPSEQSILHINGQRRHQPSRRVSQPMGSQQLDQQCYPLTGMHVQLTDKATGETHCRHLSPQCSNGVRRRSKHEPALPSHDIENQPDDSEQHVVQQHVSSGMGKPLHETQACTVQHRDDQCTAQKQNVTGAQHQHQQLHRQTNVMSFADTDLPKQAVLDEQAVLEQQSLTQAEQPSKSPAEMQSLTKPGQQNLAELEQHILDPATEHAEAQPPSTAQAQQPSPSQSEQQSLTQSGQQNLDPATQLAEAQPDGLISRTAQQAGIQQQVQSVVSAEEQQVQSVVVAEQQLEAVCSQMAASDLAEAADLSSLQQLLKLCGQDVSHMLL